MALDLLFQRWLRHLFNSEKNQSQIYPKQQMCQKMACNPTCAKWAKLRHLPHFQFKFLLPGPLVYFGHQSVEKVRLDVCSTKVFRGKDFFICG